MKKYYQGEPVNIHIQLLINITQEKNWVITTNKGLGKSPLFCGNGEWVIPIYVLHPEVNLRTVFGQLISGVLATIIWESRITLNFHLN